MVDKPEAFMLHEIEENKEYAILITTNAGAWRYAIGDTIKLIDKEKVKSLLPAEQSIF